MFDVFHQLLDLDTFELYHLNYQRPQSICQTYTVLFICRSVWNKRLVSRRNGLTPGRHYEGLKVSENPPKNGSTSELFVVVLTGKSSDVCLCIFTMSTHLAKIRALPILQAVHFATGSSGSFLHVLLIAVSESLQPISPANQSG